MKRLLKVFLFVAALSALVSACDDDTSTIGSSLIQDQVKIVVDDSFTLTGHSVASGRVQSRTILQLLGNIDAEGYGSFSSDVVTQFMPSQTIPYTDVDLDSVRLVMRMPLGGYVGDSLMPMGIAVHRLTRDLPAPIFSDFNPAGYYEPTPYATATYTATAAGLSPTEQKRKFRLINIDLPNSFGAELLAKYKESPETFATPGAFSQWFKGFYIRTSFGSGRVAQIDSTAITLYFHRTYRDEETDRDTTVYNSAAYLAVTPEIVTNNNMHYNVSPELSAKASEQAVIAAPTGYDVEIRFPAREMIEKYRSEKTLLSIINTVSLEIPTLDITNSYGLTPSPTVLLVKTSEKNDFFARSKLPNDTTSFYATYDSFNHRYVFSEMRDYILSLLDKEEITDDDMNFTICPVTIGFESNATSNNYYYYYYYYNMPMSQQLTIASVTPYVNRPSMGILDLKNSKILFTYSLQTINN